ncbi:hypothetical protein GVN21_16805 [Caulobacter sp. SLTY]|uniref:hypothetical protein n=1 Tax=Caulobacter sp. SLTY TaxID=2683262 RepID=UPI001411E580|nr:hypothetical protein [Caulobacter sp. SLTY]NBB17028.1 hypothetical protein [Caulobacter sp. SLTY]
MIAAADTLTGLLAQLTDELKARGIPLPPAVTHQWGTVGRFIRGAWRAIAAWVCVLALLVNGVILPLARLWGFVGEPLDWQGMAALVAGLGVLAHYRSKNLAEGVTT